jgi:hypothetical protein
MRTLPRLILILACLTALFSCNRLYPPEKQGQAAVDDFIYALRWKQFNAAAGFMLPEYRQAFLDRFKDLKDLTIVDVRLIETTLSEEGRRAETVIDMDYYLLPSVTIKTFRFDQTWVYFAPEGTIKGDARIITPFPPFP